MDQKIVEALDTRGIESLGQKEYATRAGVMEYDDTAGFAVTIKDEPHYLCYEVNKENSIEIPGMSNFEADLIDLDRDPEIIAEEIKTILYRLLEEGGVKLD